MCGIIGYIGKQSASPIILEGLRRLEYRGYDSAGVCVLNGAGLELRKRKGKIDDGLAKLLIELRSVELVELRIVLPQRRARLGR